MRPGRHAASDGSFGRSAGGATARGVLLLAAAVVLGIILLNTTDHSGEQQVSSRRPIGVPSVPTTSSSPPTTLPARPPRDVKVLPANGTQVLGAGARVGNTLKATGYDVLSAVSAPQAARATVVYYAAGFEREAQAVAVVLSLAPTSIQLLPTPPPFDVKGANIVVVVGPDLVGGAAGTSTTVTTSRPATTSTTRSAATTTTRPATSTTHPGATTTTTRRG